MLLSLVAFQLFPQAQAQTFSYDGQRWYEIELSIFSHTLIDSPYSEHFDSQKNLITPPESTIILSPSTASLQIDFYDELENEETVFLEHNPTEAEDPYIINANDFMQPAMQTSLPEYGAEFYSGQSTFQLQNPEKDAFISLGASAHQFSRHNQRIENSQDYRLLYHTVWRQPVLNKSQAEPILIFGGEQYGDKHELEGSVTISYNVNRIDIETALWFLTFNDEIFNAIEIDQAYLMNETRSMISGNVHYLDHPAFGLLVEVRPYELPLSENQETGSSNFE